MELQLNDLQISKIKENMQFTILLLEELKKVKIIKN
jgi:hypothetical protein